MASRSIIQNFSPTWFTAIMGTGVISVLFASFPYGYRTQTMMVLSLVVFFLNLSLFLLFSALTIVRYSLYPQSWVAMLRDPFASLYTGCFPIGMTTLIDVAVEVIHGGYGFGGRPFLYFLWAVWWINVVISALCCWGILHKMSTVQTHSLDNMTTAWLFPVVSLTVASSSGGGLALALQKYSRSHALISTTTALSLLVISSFLAFMILAIHLLRIIVHGLPQGPKVLSLLLPLGPIAKSGQSILFIGYNFQTLLPISESNSEFLRSEATGSTIYVACVSLSFMLWSIACMYIISSLLGFQNVIRQAPFSFTLTFWGLVFPNGVFAKLTIDLSIAFDTTYLRVLGAIYAVATLIIWIWIFTRTLVAVYDRTIFNDTANAIPNDIGVRSEKQSRGKPSLGSSTADVSIEGNFTQPPKS